jgi:hypothetical protein
LLSCHFFFITFCHPSAPPHNIPYPFSFPAITGIVCLIVLASRSLHLCRRQFIYTHSACPDIRVSLCCYAKQTRRVFHDYKYIALKTCLGPCLFSPHGTGRRHLNVTHSNTCIEHKEEVQIWENHTGDIYVPVKRNMLNHAIHASIVHPTKRHSNAGIVIALSARLLLAAITAITAPFVSTRVTSMISKQGIA